MSYLTDILNMDENELKNDDDDDDGKDDEKKPLEKKTEEKKTDEKKKKDDPDDMGTYECPSCGLVRSGWANFCAMCGGAMDPTMVVTVRSSKSTVSTPQPEYAPYISLFDPGDLDPIESVSDIYDEDDEDDDDDLDDDDDDDDVVDDVVDDPQEQEVEMTKKEINKPVVDFIADYRRQHRENYHWGEQELFHPGYIQHVRVEVMSKTLYHPGTPHTVYMQQEHDFSHWLHPGYFASVMKFSSGARWSCCNDPFELSRGCTNQCTTCGKVLNEEIMRYNDGYVGPCTEKARTVSISVWNCCNAKEGDIYEAGCTEKYLDTVVRRAYACCSRLEGTQGCIARFKCCNRRKGAPGCTAKREAPQYGTIAG